MPILPPSGSNIVAGNGLSQSGNTISANPDGTTLDTGGSGSSLEIKAGGVNTTQLATNAVTLAKLATQPTDTILANLTGGSAVPTAATYDQIGQALNAQYSTIQCVFNGGGSALVAGLQSWVRVPYGGTIVEASLMADESGSCVVDIWNAAFASFPPTIANSICASDLPTLSSAQTETDTTLTGWATAFSTGSVFLFNLTSISTIKELTVYLKVKRI